MDGLIVKGWSLCLLFLVGLDDCTVAASFFSSLLWQPDFWGNSHFISLSTSCESASWSCSQGDVEMKTVQGGG